MLRSKTGIWLLYCSLWPLRRSDMRCVHVLHCQIPLGYQMKISLFLPLLCWAVYLIELQKTCHLIIVSSISMHLRCRVPMFGIIKVLKGVAEAYLKVRLEQNAFRLCFLGYTIVKLNLIHGLNIKWGISSVFIFHGKKQVNNCCTWI